MSFKCFLALVLAMTTPLWGAEPKPDYQEAINKALEALKAQKISIQEITLLKRTEKVKGNTVGFLDVQFDPSRKVTLNILLDLNGAPWPSDRFQSMVVDRVMHNIDISVVGPNGVSITPTMAIYHVLKDLTDLQKQIKAASTSDKPGQYKHGTLYEILAPFHEAYIRGLLKQLGVVSFKVGEERKHFDFRGLEFKADHVGFRRVEYNAKEILIDFKTHAPESLDKDLKIKLLTELAEVSEYYQRLSTGLGLEKFNFSQIEKIMVDALLTELEALSLELQLLLEYRIITSAAKYSERGRWSFRLQIQEVFKRILKLEKSGIRLKYSLAPLEVGSKLLSFQENLAKFEAKGLTLDAQETYQNSLSVFERSVHFEIAKLEAHRQALLTLKTDQKSTEWKTLVEQLDALDVQFLELERIKKQFKGLKVVR